MTERFNYKRYLASREWALLREQVRERSEGNCERCLINEMTQVNHLTYERIGHEHLEDLQAVCRPCHEYMSGLRHIDPADVSTWMAQGGFTFWLVVKRTYSTLTQIQDRHMQNDGARWFIWFSEMEQKYGPEWWLKLAMEEIGLGWVEFDWLGQLSMRLVTTHQS